MSLKRVGRADGPENELQHDIFAVQREKCPEEAQRHHAELQHRHTGNSLEGKLLR